MNKTDRIIEIAENALFNPQLNYIVFEWNRYQPNQMVDQLEITPNNESFNMRIHRFSDAAGNFEDQDILVMNDIDEQTAIGYIKEYAPQITYIQAEYLDSEDIMAIEL